MERVNLGDRVRDMVSGAEGIVTSRTEYMYGCVRLGIQPKAKKDGDQVQSFAADEPQVKIVKQGAIANVVSPQIKTAERRHGDRPTPLSRPSVTSR